MSYPGKNSENRFLPDFDTNQEDMPPPPQPPSARKMSFSEEYNENGFLPDFDMNQDEMPPQPQLLQPNTMSYSERKSENGTLRDFEVYQRDMPPPPLPQSPPPLPVSKEYPILYEIITQKGQDINGNVVDHGSSSPANATGKKKRRKTESEAVGSSSGYVGNDRGNGDDARLQSKKQNKQETHSVLHIPTWLFYFRNEYLTRFPKFQDAVVNPEAEDQILNSKISFWFGDIRDLEVDAVVNSTTSHFDGTSGVDFAIHYSAGPELSEKCRQLNPCEIGGIRITEGFNLPSKYIIHTVAPIDGNPEALRSCYTRSLIFLRQQGLKTIAFPCIGTGGKGFPRVGAARIALSSVRVFLEVEKDNLDRIIFCVHNKPNTQIYVRFLQTYFPSTR